MKEKFFYLEQKYGVNLLINNQFGKKGNIYSLYVAGKHLGNTYVCCADHYFLKNLVLMIIWVIYRIEHACIFLENLENLQLIIRMPRL